ncbi:MAG: hypothetical protein IT210_14920 [Armatimonadetes bacterium]|nr:hypothetical protein [Armatimonadota bacterium]
MLYATISVDCESANHSRCYTKSLIEVSEACEIPLNWMLRVSASDPLANAKLYYEDYFHRIPAWHEYGLHVHFESESGYIREPQHRANLIRLGKEILKQHHIKPTSFIAGHYALEPSDVPVLEDIGILVDGSPAPGLIHQESVDWSDAPIAPYHPDPDRIKEAGRSSLLIVPLATHEGKAAYLGGNGKNGAEGGDCAFEAVRPILEWHSDHTRYLSLRTQDTADCADTLMQTVAFLKEKGALFVTLTQMHSIVDFESSRS